jgi:hypothetical protein
MDSPSSILSVDGANPHALATLLVLKKQATYRTVGIGAALPAIGRRRLTPTIIGAVPWFIKLAQKDAHPVRQGQR